MGTEIGKMQVSNQKDYRTVNDWTENIIGAMIAPEIYIETPYPLQELSPYAQPQAQPTSQAAQTHHTEDFNLNIAIDLQGTQNQINPETLRAIIPEIERTIQRNLYNDIDKKRKAQ